MSHQILGNGAFTELSAHGSWAHGPSPGEYVARVRRYADEIGGLVFAAPQDWMREPAILRGGQFAGMHFAGTGLTVGEHQRRTVENFLELLELAPDLPFIPVLQGWSTSDYLLRTNLAEVRWRPRALRSVRSPNACRGCPRWGQADDAYDRPADAGVTIVLGEGCSRRTCMVVGLRDR